MEDFQTVVELFLKELQKFDGSVPTFKVNYQTKSLILIEAPSGFLSQLYANRKVIGHLRKDGVHIEMLQF